MEYSSAFLGLMALARGRAEQQLGDNVLPAQEPDWSQVLDRGAELLKQTRDLRVLVTTTRAATEIDGLSGLAGGLRLIHAWLVEHWDTLHPMIVSDGERDPLLRMNALAALADPEGMLRTVRAAPLLESHGGTVTVGDADLVLRGRPAAATAVVSSAEHLSRLVIVERDRNVKRISILSDARETLAAIEATWRERVEADYWPELGPLVATLDRVEAVVVSAGALIAARQGSAEGSLPSDAAAVSAGALKPAGALPARIDTRAEVFRALAIARAYFEAHEPSHPAPLLIRRIEGLSDLDFAQILADLAPEGLAQLQQLAGPRS